MLLEPVGGVHLELASDADMFPFDDIKDYRDYIKRLQRVPALIDQVIEISRQGAQDGLTQPRYLLETLPAQIRKIAEAAGADSPFASPLKTLDQVVTDAAQRAQLRAALITAIDQQVRPAYETLAAFVQNEYAAKGREHEGYGRCRMGRHAIVLQFTRRPPLTVLRRTFIALVCVRLHGLRVR